MCANTVVWWSFWLSIMCSINQYLSVSKRIACANTRTLGMCMQENEGSDYHLNKTQIHCTVFFEHSLCIFILFARVYCMPITAFFVIWMQDIYFDFPAYQSKHLLIHVCCNHKSTTLWWDVENCRRLRTNVCLKNSPYLEFKSQPQHAYCEDNTCTGCQVLSHNTINMKGNRRNNIWEEPGGTIHKSTAHSSLLKAFKHLEHNGPPC